MTPRKTIFIIDHNRSDLLTFKNAVAEIDPRARCFGYTNSITALRRLFAVKSKPSLIVVDIQMPLVSGKDWLLLLKNEPSLFQIPIVACSSMQDNTSMGSSIAKYAYEFFRKPLPLSDVKETFKEILSKN